MGNKYVICTIAAGTGKQPAEIADVRIFVDEKNNNRWQSLPSEGKNMKLPAGGGIWTMVDDELILGNEGHLGLIQLYKVRADFIEFIYTTKSIITGSGIFSRTNIEIAYVISMYGW